MFIFWNNWRQEILPFGFSDLYFGEHFYWVINFYISLAKILDEILNFFWKVLSSGKLMAYKREVYLIWFIFIAKIYDTVNSEIQCTVWGSSNSMTLVVEYQYRYMYNFPDGFWLKLTRLNEGFDIFVIKECRGDKIQIFQIILLCQKLTCSKNDFLVKIIGLEVPYSLI